jgi:hypothetical protein
VPRWTDELEQLGRTKVRKSRKQRLQGKIEQVIVQIRAATDDGDPGEVAIGHFVVEDSVLCLVDEEGQDLKGAKPVKLENLADARAVAANLIRRRRGDENDFNRPLVYRPLGIA